MSEKALSGEVASQAISIFARLLTDHHSGNIDLPDYATGFNVDRLNDLAATNSKDTPND